jgi:hypothetical protein
MSNDQLTAALADLRQAFADAGALVGIVVELRRNADQLLVPLATELLRVKSIIDDVLQVLPPVT